MCTHNAARVGWLLAYLFAAAAASRIFEFEGSCGDTAAGEGDCANGDRGSWPLGLKVEAQRTRKSDAWNPWNLAVAQCAARCQSCSRCAFVSVSKQRNACFWFSESACELRKNSMANHDGFYTYRVPSGMPSSCVLEPEERMFAMVLGRLSQLPIKAMRNSSVVADFTREVGLVHDAVRPLYGREKMHMHTKRGFGLYQLPEQVGCLLSELADLPTRLRTFVEVGSFYGWTGLFFTNYARQLFTSRMAEHGRDVLPSTFPPFGFRSASFDVIDFRTPCVTALMAQYGHSFHRLPSAQRLDNGTRVPRPTLADRNNAAARAWYLERFAESKLSSASATEEASKIDVCFIDAGHAFAHVSADVRFFQPRCRFLLFHDIVDADSYGVRAAWHWLSSGLRQERNRITMGDTTLLDSPAWAVEHGFFVKECTQQAGTRRSNFGLGLISAERLNISRLNVCPCRFGNCKIFKCQF
jgi:hypothetical protein